MTDYKVGRVLSEYDLLDLHADLSDRWVDGSASLRDLAEEIVEYMAEYADYLVVALLPEDAQALPAEYHRVTDI